MDNEHILVSFEASSADEMLHTGNCYLKICRPSEVTTVGLFEMLQGALQTLGIMDVKDSLN